MRSKNNYLIPNLFAIIFLASLFLPPQITQGGKLPTYAKNGMVVSATKIASAVGREILQDGGNAIDAAVATAFALAVTWPSAGNIGGGGFLVYFNSNGDVSTIDFREKAPIAATQNMFVDKNGFIKDKSNHDGILSVGVPGTVAGLFKAHQLYGKKEWSELVAPAIKLADKGFEFTWALYDHTKSDYIKTRLCQYISSQKVFYKNDKKPYQPGEIWRQPDLAQTLKRIQKHGYDGFYKGKTADMLVEFIKSYNGLLSHKDLLSYKATVRRPIHGSYRGYDIYSMPPPSSGGIALVEMLNILETFDLEQLGFNSAQYLHLLTETMRRAYADRALYLGDPDFNNSLPQKRLLSKEYAKELAATINLQTASVSDSAKFNNKPESEETTHLSVVDSDGNAVSLTYTLEFGYGSGIVAEGLGFLLNNEMGDFNAIPGLTNTKGRIGTRPNLIAPQKRMLSSMTPTIVAKDGKPVIILGSPGGRTIINTVLQVIINVIDFEMPLAQAIEAGRIHHQWLPDETRIENWTITKDTEVTYKAMGHRLSYRSFLGRVFGIYINQETGTKSGVADSRSPDGTAVGY